MKTQQLVNSFPRWTQARRDPSSATQRLLSEVGVWLDDQHAQSVKLDDAMKLNGAALGYDGIYATQLLPADFMSHTTGAGGGITPVYPTTVTGDGVTLAAVETLEELFYGVPDQFATKSTFTFTNDVVWSSAASTTYNTIDQPEFLWIDVSASTDYLRRALPPTGQPHFSGVQRVIIEGYDYNNNSVVEEVFIQDDGVYRTKFIYNSVSSVSLDGFSGTVSIYCVPNTLTMRPNPYVLAVTEELEGPLYHRLVTNGIYSQLMWETPEQRFGQSYRTNQADDDELYSENMQEIASVSLRDSGGNAITALDFAVSPHDMRIYVLDNGGNIHIYEPVLETFTPPANVSRDTDIELHPVAHRVAINETIRIGTRYARPTAPVRSVYIFRVSPSNVTEYLQADKTWSGTIYNFSGRNSTQVIKVAETWTDFDFTSTFSEFGEWRFYCVTTTDTATSTYSTAVMADSATAVASLSTAIANPQGIYFSHDQTLCVVGTGQVTRLDTWKAAYHPQFRQQNLWVNRPYAALVVDGSTYTPVWVDVPNFLDEWARHQSIRRLPGESISDYRKRIMGHALGDPPALKHGHDRGLNRFIGGDEKRVLEVDVVRNADGTTLATDPYIEITSTRFTAYSDKANGTVDFTVDFTTQAGEFLEDIVTAVTASANFTVATQRDYSQWLRCEFLMEDISVRKALYLAEDTTHIQLPETDVRTIRFNRPRVFLTEQATAALVASDGDYWVDKTNGVVIAHSPARGAIDYTHSTWPMSVYWLEARAFRWDDDIQYLAYDAQVGDAGNEYNVLNPEGADLLALLSDIHSDHWGA